MRRIALAFVVASTATARRAPVAAPRQPPPSPDADAAGQRRAGRRRRRRHRRQRRHRARADRRRLRDPRGRRAAADRHVLRSRPPVRAARAGRGGAAAGRGPQQPGDGRGPGLPAAARRSVRDGGADARACSRSRATSSTATCSPAISSRSTTTGGMAGTSQAFTEDMSAGRPRGRSLRRQEGAVGGGRRSSNRPTGPASWIRCGPAAPATPTRPFNRDGAVLGVNAIDDEVLDRGASRCAP